MHRAGFDLSISSPASYHRIVGKVVELLLKEIVIGVFS